MKIYKIEWTHPEGVCMHWTVNALDARRFISAKRENPNFSATKFSLMSYDLAGAAGLVAWLNANFAERRW